MPVYLNNQDVDNQEIFPKKVIKNDIPIKSLNKRVKPKPKIIESDTESETESDETSNESSNSNSSMDNNSDDENTDHESESEEEILEFVKRIIPKKTSTKKPITLKKVVKKPAAIKLTNQEYYDNLKVLDYTETKTYSKFIEKVDVDKLNFIVSNYDKFKDILRADQDLDNPKAMKYDPLKLARDYLSKSVNGEVEVKYIQKRGVGRLFAEKGLSLQSLKKKIRHTISQEYYDDIDMVNAHPTILKFICDMNGWACPILTKYCNNRDKFFRDMGMPRDEAKTLILKIINGGMTEYNALKNPPKDLKKFTEEIPKIHELIIVKHSKQYQDHLARKQKKNDIHNVPASFMNIILCDIENKILQTVFDFFGKDMSASLIFDGLMLRKGRIYDFTACENYVFDKLHIKVKFTTKPMDEGLDLSQFYIPKYEEVLLTHFADFNKLVEQNEIPLNYALKWMNTSITLIENGGRNFLLTKNKTSDIVTGMTRTYFKQIEEEDLLKGLKVSCKIINPNFDQKYFDTNQDTKKDKIDFNKFNKYLYTTLGSSVGKDKKGFLGDYIYSRKVPKFNTVDFYPYLERKGMPNIIKEEEINNDSFNMFTGFPLERVKLVEEMKFEDSHLYKHIRDELCNGNIGEFEHLMDHIADMVQEPAVIKTNAHLFYTKQGMGKGLLGSFMSKILGSDHVISFENTEAYFGKFNADQANKILKIFEEVSDKGAAFKNHDRLKGDQSKTMERIEPKGIDPYSLRHCARFWYYTNNENSLYIEGDDRRFTCHKANNRYANNDEYFAPLWAEVRSNQFCKNAFEYFATRIYDTKNARMCYSNDFKREQKILNLNGTMEFLKELVEEGFDIETHGNNVPVIELKKHYQIFCETNRKECKIKTLKTQLKRIEIEETRNHSIDGVKTRCYTMSKEILLEKFRSYLQDPKFEFDE